MSNLLDSFIQKEKCISVTGLGYVGLPLALEFAKHFRVIGFDINQERIALMQQGIDPSKELDSSAFEGCDISFTSNVTDLQQAHFHIIGVPTDIDSNKVPNLNPLLGATKSVASALKKGDVVVYESTVYPGCTEDDCLPILESISGLQGGKDFKYGYSPERIVPGDKVRTLTNILKIVSGNDAEALELIAGIYGSIIKAGLHRAESIKVAEAAKVIENCQRDLNISFVNDFVFLPIASCSLNTKFKNLSAPLVDLKPDNPLTKSGSIFANSPRPPANCFTPPPNSPKPEPVKEPVFPPLSFCKVCINPSNKIFCCSRTPDICSATSCMTLAEPAMSWALLAIAFTSCDIFYLSKKNDIP